jgi:hypothetical protein
VDGLWKTSGLVDGTPAAEAKALGQRAVEVGLKAFLVIGRLDARLLRVPQVDVQRFDLLDQEEDRLARGTQLVTLGLGEPRSPASQLVDLVFVQTVAQGRSSCTSIP